MHTEQLQRASGTDRHDMVRMPIKWGSECEVVEGTRKRGAKFVLGTQCYQGRKHREDDYKVAEPFCGREIGGAVFGSSTAFPGA